jgi:hypothetical protein
MPSSSELANKIEEEKVFERLRFLENEVLPLAASHVINRLQFLEEKVSTLEKLLKDRQFDIETSDK